MGTRQAKVATKAVGGDGGSADLRGRFIDVGLQVFLRRSYNGSRISDITDAVGVAKGTFYLYFRDKRELLLACLAHVHAMVGDREARLEHLEDDPLGRLIARLLIGLEQHSIWDNLPAFLLKVSTYIDETEISRAAWQAWVAVTEPSRRDLQKAIDQDAAREVDVELALLAFTGMVDTLGWRAKHDDSYDARSMVSLGKKAMEGLLQPTPTLDPRAVGRDGIRAVLVDCTGLRVELKRLMFDHKSRIHGCLGRGRVVVEIARLKKLIVNEAGDECRVELRLDDDATATVIISGDVEISGDSNLGEVTFALRDIATLTFPPGDGSTDETKTAQLAERSGSQAEVEAVSIQRPA
jgi:AcrR family transcriptional regulator